MGRKRLKRDRYSSNNFEDCSRVESPWPDKNLETMGLRRPDSQENGLTSISFSFYEISMTRKFYIRPRHLQ